MAQSRIGCWYCCPLFACTAYYYTETKHNLEEKYPFQTYGGPLLAGLDVAIFKSKF